MATFFSGTYIGYWNVTSNHLVGTLTGDVSRSGNTVTLSGMVLTFYPQQSSYGTSDFTFTVNGVGTYKRISPTDTVYLNNTSFSVTSSQTSASVGWSSSDGYSGSFTVTFPAQGTAPSGGYVNNLTSTFNETTNQFDFTGTAGVTNTGGLDLTLLNCLIAEVPYVSGIARQQVDLVNGGSFTINNDSPKQGGGITIVANHLYYFGLYASNSAGDYRYQGPSIVTQAAKAINQSVTDITETSAIINWTAPADGGYYGKIYSYSLDNGDTWTTCGSISGGPDQRDRDMTYTISGLAPATAYTIKLKVVTNAGVTLCNDFPTFTTLGAQGHPLYGSVNGQTKKIKKLYGSANGQTKLIKHLYGSVNGVTKKIF